MEWILPALILAFLTNACVNETMSKPKSKTSEEKLGDAIAAYLKDIKDPKKK